MKNKWRNVSLRFSGQPQRGFSMVELIVVIAVAAILSTIAIMKLNNNSLSVRMKAAAEKMMNDIQYAQELASTTANGVKVIIDPSNNRYLLKWSDDTPVENILGGGPFVVDFNSSNFAGVTIGGSQLDGNTLYFNSMGVPTSGGNELVNETKVVEINGQLIIYITPYTGKLRLEGSAEE